MGEKMIYARELLKHTFVGVLTTCLILDYCLSPAQDLCDERSYEPVVVQGDLLSHFFGIPVNEIVMYSYDGDTQSWRMIPFQIDEKTFGTDPYNPPRNRWFYFIPEEWDIDSHDNDLSDHDELVFMVRDLGDRAPENAWIDNDEAKSHARMELVASDPDDPDKKAYGYLYHSSTIQEEVPTPYGFDYVAEEDRIGTTYYTVSLSTHGMVQDIVIKEPWGNGQDIFDTLKLRFGGIIDIAISPIEIIMTEENLYRYDDIKVSQKPIVRFIRQARQTLQIGPFISHDTPFYLTIKFYPFSAKIETGASISTKDLSEMYLGAEISILLYSMRQSWDFNANAEGMKFSNKYNDDILIDGRPDSINRIIDIPINEWSFVSGAPGSVLTFLELQEANWNNIELYYHDNQKGGQADSPYHGTIDTGDKTSYGDNGILFLSDGRDSLNLDSDLTMFLIPETNLQKSDGEELAHHIIHPVQLTSTLKSDVKNEIHTHIPNNVILLQNHPNPFNNTTVIPFDLPTAEMIRLCIFDINGRNIRTLVEGLLEAGSHKRHWHGRDDQGKRVASGIYFYDLSSKNYSQTKKLILVQ